MEWLAEVLFAALVPSDASHTDVPSVFEASAYSEYLFVYLELAFSDWIHLRCRSIPSAFFIQRFCKSS